MAGKSSDARRVMAGKSSDARRVMAGRAGNTPKISITSKGVVSVDANELFESHNVKEFIKEMAQFEKKSQAS